LHKIPRGSPVLIEFWDCSEADMELEARKCEKDQNIRVSNLRLLDFKNVSKSQRR